MEREHVTRATNGSMGKHVKNNNNGKNLKKGLTRREYSGRAEGTEAVFVRVFEFWETFSGVGVL